MAGKNNQHLKNNPKGIYALSICFYITKTIMKDFKLVLQR